MASLPIAVIARIGSSLDLRKVRDVSMQFFGQVVGSMHRLQFQGTAHQLFEWMRQMETVDLGDVEVLSIHVVREVWGGMFHRSDLECKEAFLRDLQNLVTRMRKLRILVLNDVPLCESLNPNVVGDALGNIVAQLPNLEVLVVFFGLVTQEMAEGAKPVNWAGKEKACERFAVARVEGLQ